MKKLLRSESLYGIGLTLLVLFFYFQPGSVLEKLELKFYDIRSEFRTPGNPSKDIALIAIDDKSIEKIGRWPWSRSKIADLLGFLSQEAAKPKVIGLNILFSEEENQGLSEIVALKDAFEAAVAAREQELKKQKPRFAKTDWGQRQSFKWWEDSLVKDKELLEAINSTRIKFDNDAKLETAISSAGNVVLPLFFTTGSNIGGKASELPEALGKSALIVERSPQQEAGGLLSSFQATLPLARFAEKSAGAGHVNTQGDPDGTIRREPLAIAYGDQVFPSFALELVRHYLGFKNDELTVRPGQGILMGTAEIPLDGDGNFAITFSPQYKNPEERTFSTSSFYDVLQGNVTPEVFKGKVVLVGLTAAGLGNVYVTPIEGNLPGLDIVANVIDNLFNKRFLLRPSWGFMAELVLILLTGAFVSFLLPRLKALPGAVISGAGLIVILAAGFILFASQGQWLKVTYPAFLLAAGYIVGFTKKDVTTKKKKEQVEGESIETNKMLGLSFQGQGMLDLAFEKFRKCPIVDDSMKELLYNLGLDFERKRQFNKAVAVYEHIAGKDKNYKDLTQKIGNLKKAADGAIMGGPLGKSKEATVMVEGASIKPTLGRYEIEKELGKGAMGIVYLGRDPKINRQVAIKTMRFEDDVDEATIKAVKERFFREAESAGNLSHPNIIKIHDAGEEQDMSYIAMELLDGVDLKKFTDKANLLPIAKVVEYASLIADALGYAHKQGVVHRDIKPANIMLLKDGTIRVTDFGIARITASSKTATGTVLGTPSYMSPEQIAGKKVDGRTDLFSLGVMLFELLTGEKPWKGGESIGTLLFQIANDPHPDPLGIRSDMPAPLAAVITRALKKNPDERYQTGYDIAADLKAFSSASPAAATSAPAAPPPAAAPKISSPAAPAVPAAAPAKPAPAAPVASKPATPQPAVPAPTPAAPPAKPTIVPTAPAATPATTTAIPPATPPAAAPGRLSVPEALPSGAEKKTDGQPMPGEKTQEFNKTLKIEDPDKTIPLIQTPEKKP